MVRKRRLTPKSLVLSVLALCFGALVWSVCVQCRHDYLDRRLIEAIQGRRTDEAIGWLAHGADPNARASLTPQSTSLLDWLEIVVGRRPRPRYDGPSALILAVESDETRVVQALLARGARNVDATDQVNDPLIVLAARHHNPTVVRSLLDRHADANARGHGETALIAAAGNEDLDSVKLLIQHGADVNAHDGGGDTALTAAASVAFLDEQEIERPAWRKAATARPTYDVLKLLLDHGADINALDSMGYTALYYIANLHDAKCEKLFLDRGADFRLRLRWSATPLYSAVENGRTDLVRTLLARGADPNELEERHGNTVLMEAAANGDFEIVQLLLDRGARVNDQDDGQEFCTALVAAAKNQAPVALIRLLLRRGANVHPRDINGNTALDWAIYNNEKPAVALLKQAGAGK